jgi:hypothetical protein
MRKNYQLINYYHYLLLLLLFLSFIQAEESFDHKGGVYTNILKNNGMH